MDSAYPFSDIEAQAQTHWTTAKLFEIDTKNAKNPYYCLSMFPYTSGELHMGHVRNYTIGDVISRAKRMQGFDVLQPIGWDSFGLPAENAAQKHNSHPSVWTRSNIERMRGDFKRLGFGYAWEREFATCDPEYYRWQQWLFLQMHKHNLVYKKDTWVNWDPVDQTVLANEQVIDGKGWRSDAPVERKKIPGWFCQISDYSDRLLDDLETLEHWPEAIKTMQRNWIGRSEGTEVVFQVLEHDSELKVFTTRADTLYGATYLALAPDHPLALEQGRKDPAIQAFIDSCQTQSTKEADCATVVKKGVATSLNVQHPLLNKTLPVWIANYVLMDYGSGAVMAVPAEDERDFEFAKLYNLPCIEVIEKHEGQERMIQSGPATGLTPNDAKAAVTKLLIEKKLGRTQVNIRLRDWGISRQRYWGVPIPIVHCPKCGEVPVPEQDLPVTLPTDADYGDGLDVLKKHSAFYNCQCPKCGDKAHRETDTFDTFFDSSWYYHYFVHQSEESMLASQNNNWSPVNTYIGGIEHAILHLLYARFIQKVLCDLNLSTCKEPFDTLLSQGMVLKDGAKMSKSKGNVVSPQALIEQYGADTVRLFAIFAAPPEQSLEWSDGGVEGCFRFLRKLHQKVLSWKAHLGGAKACTSLDEQGQELRYQAHSLLASILRDLEQHRLNTIASSAMKLLHTAEACWQQQHFALLDEVVSLLLRVLNPICPHVCTVLWQKAGYAGDVQLSTWPEPDASALSARKTFQCVVQINGKTKGTLALATGISQELAQSEVMHHRSFSKYFEGKTLRKVIFVADKLLNVVLS